MSQPYLTFKGRCCIVTGAGQGLGEVYARILASRGAAVVVTDLGDSCEVVAASIRSESGEAISVRGSVTSEAHVEAVVTAAMERYGRVDVLVNKFVRVLSFLWLTD